MTRIELSEQDWLTIVHALRVASDLFAQDATTVCAFDICERTKRALIEQFDQQATDTYILADRIEEVL